MTVEDLDRLIEEIITDAYGDDKQLRAFHCALEDGIELPCDALVVGEPVSVVEFDYDGNQRRGLVARCRRVDGSQHRVSAIEVVLAEHSNGGHLIAAYRKWSGLDPWPEQAAPPFRRKRQHKVAPTDPYLSVSGEIESSRLDIDASGLVPLKLEDRGLWTPEEHYWVENDEPIAAQSGSSRNSECGPLPLTKEESKVKPYFRYGRPL